MKHSERWPPGISIVYNYPPLSGAPVKVSRIQNVIQVPSKYDIHGHRPIDGNLTLLGVPVEKLNNMMEKAHMLFDIGYVDIVLDAVQYFYCCNLSLFLKKE